MRFSLRSSPTSCRPFQSCSLHSCANQIHDHFFSSKSIIKALFYVFWVDTYAALDNGVIDGVVAPLETLNTCLLADIIQHITYLPGHSGPSISRYANKESLSSLSPDIQEIIFTSSNIWSTTIYQTRLEHDEIGRKLAVDRDVEFIAITEEEIAVYKKSFKVLRRYSRATT